MRKPAFAYAKTKPQISFAVTAKLISAFAFATRIVQSLYFLNPKFQASSHLLWLYSLVCIGPGRKPRRPVFSERGSHVVIDVDMRELFCNSSVKDKLKKVWYTVNFLNFYQDNSHPCNICTPSHPIFVKFNRGIHFCLFLLTKPRMWVRLLRIPSLRSF